MARPSPCWCAGGLRPRLARRDLPFPPDLDGDAAEALARRLGHYAFRLLLRGAILARGAFLPEEATRYLAPAQARALADELVALGLAARAAGRRYRLRRRASNFGGTLEWWVGRELARRLALDVATGVRSGARGVGGDLDIVAAAGGPPRLPRAQVLAPEAHRAERGGGVPAPLIVPDRCKTEDEHMAKNTIFLWYNKDAEAAGPLLHQDLSR